MSLGLALLILGLLLLLIFSPSFRRIAAVALGILVLALLILIGWFQQNETAQKRKDEKAKTFIKTNQVQLVDPRVSFSSYDGRPEKITGRVRNNSTHALQSLEVKLLFEDCSPQNDCETVGEETDVIYGNVPPAQSRDFVEYLSGSTISPKGRITWSYQVISVSARVE